MLYRAVIALNDAGMKFDYCYELLEDNIRRVVFSKKTLPRQKHYQTLQPIGPWTDMAEGFLVSRRVL
jgi:hypothetical protein